MIDNKSVWTEAFSKKRFVIQFVFCFVAILIVVSFLPYFFHSIIGPKPGIRLNDFVLNHFSPRDWSWLIFGIIYLSLVIVVQGIVKKPNQMLLGLKCYLLITVVRMISMFLITLEAPEGIIPLHDPLMDVIAYGGNVFNKDLFFSGHVATLTLFVLIEERPVFKRILLVNAFLVAILILWQRVHYTVDVMVATLMTYLIFRLLKR